MSAVHFCGQCAHYEEIAPELELEGKARSGWGYCRARPGMARPAKRRVERAGGYWPEDAIRCELAVLHSKPAAPGMVGGESPSRSAGAGHETPGAPLPSEVDSSTQSAAGSVRHPKMPQG